MHSFSSSLKYAVATSIILAGAGCNPHPPGPAPVPHWNVVLNTDIDLNNYRASLPGPPLSGGHTRSRLGRGCGNCWTNVSIQAYSWARDFGAARFPATPGEMYPIGHIVNTGTVETEMYSLKPSTIAEYDIYITNDAGSAAWQIIEVPNSATGKLTVRKKGTLYACPGHRNRTNSEADFRNCDYGASAGTLRFAGSAKFEELIARFMSRLSRAPFTGEDPGWLSCTEGCCTLTNES